MNRYSKAKDVSAQVKPGGGGMTISRRCFGCNQNRMVTGGTVDRRTRQWICVTCTQAVAR